MDLRKRAGLASIATFVLATACGTARPTDVRQPHVPAASVAARPSPSPTPVTATIQPTGRQSAAPSAPSPSAKPDFSPLAVVASRPPWLDRLGGAIFFLRRGAVWRLDVRSGADARVLDDVDDFDLSHDGRSLAFARGRALWVARANGTDVLRVAPGILTSRPHWSSRGALAYSAAPSGSGDWSARCRASRVFVWDPASGSRTLADGCEPAWSPDGLRLAYATPPVVVVRSDGWVEPVANAIRNVNARGENGWDAAWVSVSQPNVGGAYLHAPVWSADGRHVLFSRFLGVPHHFPIAYVERTDSRTGVVEKVAIGSGSVVAVSPDSRHIAIRTCICSDAGFLGWNNETPGTLDMSWPSDAEDLFSGVWPPRRLTLVATRTWSARRASSAAWSPDGSAIGFVYPAARPGAETFQPPPGPYNDSEGGELVVRDGTTGEVARVASDVEFSSPLVWSTR